MTEPAFAKHDDLRALAEAATQSKSGGISSDYGVSISHFHDAATPAVVLDLLDQADRLAEALPFRIDDPPESLAPADLFPEPGTLYLTDDGEVEALRRWGLEHSSREALRWVCDWRNLKARAEAAEAELASAREAASVAEDLADVVKNAPCVDEDHATLEAERDALKAENAELRRAIDLITARGAE